MNTMTPTDIVNTATMFRMFLRNNFYPSNQQIMYDGICSNIADVVDIDWIAENNEYRIKCKQRRAITPEMYYMQIENALMCSFGTGHLHMMIMQSELQKKNKDMITEVYDNIRQFIHLSVYLKMLYSCAFLVSNTSTRMLSVIL